MNYDKLEKNIIDVIKEQQIKLGYRSEDVRLYYPLSSIVNLLETELDEDAAKNALEGFAISRRAKYGLMKISGKDSRFCIRIPAQGSDYIHEFTQDNEFISAFISEISRPECNIEDILAVFRRYSDNVIFENTDNGEFDYLIYFADGIPDNFRYCIHQEAGHIIYHRYTPEDYKELGL